MSTDKRLVVVAALRHVVRWSFILFWAGVGGLALLVHFASDQYPTDNEVFLGISTVLLVIVSGLTYIATLFASNFIASGIVNWQFSVRSLLVITTVLAVSLGLVVWLSRYFAKTM